jgi:cytochrome P450
VSAHHPRAERPAHIPAAAVYDFDIHFDDGLLKDPHKRSLELVKEAPSVFWTPYNGGHWVAINFREAHSVPRQPEIFSSMLILPEHIQMLESLMPAGSRLPQLIPIMLDPPEHTKFRLPLQKAFSPKTIQALESDITALATSLVDSVRKHGSCDFMASVAEQFPVRIFLKMMGLPAEKLAEFRALASEVFAPREHEAAVFFIMRKIADAMKDDIRDRRERPQQDLISMLWGIEVDGEPMSMELMEDYSVLLFLAGLDTVVNAIGFGMHHLARDQQLQECLRASPDLIADATEELLRRYTFTVQVRRTLQDTELGGWAIKAGERVVSYYPVADLDDSEFPDAARFDLGRENKGHMAFGVGPHRCLGSHLARLELQTLYRVVLERLPVFRLDPEKPIQYRAGMNLSIPSLHLKWEA